MDGKPDDCGLQVRAWYAVLARTSQWYILYRHKHNYIPYSTFTITKVQLHVSAINFDHLQVVHEALNDELYLHVRGEFTVCGVGWVRDLVLCL